MSLRGGQGEYGRGIIRGSTHGAHPASLAALSTLRAQDSAQGGRVLSCAWENEMYREERTIGKVMKKLNILDVKY
jgi:hypothetical protein